MDDVEEAFAILQRNDLVLLHCTSAYPAPVEHANLKAMTALRTRFVRPVGYSDHTVCTDALVAAAAMGAVVIEAHITRNRGQRGPDHLSSYEPGQFRDAVGRIRQVEAMLGSGEKKPQDSERMAMEVWA